MRGHLAIERATLVEIVGATVGELMVRHDADVAELQKELQAIKTDLAAERSARQQDHSERLRAAEVDLRVYGEKIRAIDELANRLELRIAKYFSARFSESDSLPNLRN